jgi:hypothetical protein
LELFGIGLRHLAKNASGQALTLALFSVLQETLKLRERIEGRAMRDAPAAVFAKEDWSEVMQNLSLEEAEQAFVPEMPVAVAKNPPKTPMSASKSIIEVEVGDDGQVNEILHSMAETLQNSFGHTHTHALTLIYTGLFHYPRLQLTVDPSGCNLAPPYDWHPSQCLSALLPRHYRSCLQLWLGHEL